MMRCQHEFLLLKPTCDKCAKHIDDVVLELQADVSELSLLRDGLAKAAPPPVAEAPVPGPGEAAARMQVERLQELQAALPAEPVGRAPWGACWAGTPGCRCCCSWP